MGKADPAQGTRLAIGTRPPFEPTAGTVNHSITKRLRPDFKRAVCFGLLALMAGTVVRMHGGLWTHSLTDSAIALTGSVSFVALAVMAVRSVASVASVASEVADVSRARFGDAHGSVVALLLTLVG